MPMGICPREFIPTELGPKTLLHVGMANGWVFPEVPVMEENAIGLT